MALLAQEVKLRPERSANFWIHGFVVKVFDYADATRGGLGRGSLVIIGQSREVLRILTSGDAHQQIKIFGTLGEEADTIGG